MAYKFSQASVDAMKGVHPKLVAVLLRAIALSSVDFKVIEGVRSKERQEALYAQGRTKPGKVVTWTLNSNHFIQPSTGYGHAVDILPAPYDWKDMKQFDLVADAIMAAAKELGVKVRHGADWDMDGIRREKGETDAPHFEIVL